MFEHLSLSFLAVMINDVETNPLGNVRVNEGTRNNRILYEMTALTDPSSGKAQGKNLWEMSTFGSSFPDGRGRRFNPQTAYTFTQYQKDKSAFPGENIRYGAVDTNMDMTGLTCNDVRYFCSELRKGDYPSPDFEMIANPSEDVLTDCFELNCEGTVCALIRYIFTMFHRKLSIFVSSVGNELNFFICIFFNCKIFISKINQSYYLSCCRSFDRQHQANSQL